MTARTLHLVVPGALEQRTGGYLYDAHVVDGLRALGWTVRVHNLTGSFPAPDAEATESMRATLRAIPDGATVVIDGLAMGGLPGPIGEVAGRLRVISLVHHPLAEETGLSEEDRSRFRASEVAALDSCAGVIVTSPFTARVLADFDVPPDRIEVVPPGTTRRPLAEGPGAGRPPSLLCVATVAPRKGHDVLVPALEQLRDLPWTCTCAGSLDRAPDFAREVRERVRAAGLDDRIDFPGEQSEEGLGSLYRAASVFVLPSYYEGYGMALAEAIVCGLPVVSTTGGAIPFTVPAEAGILVPPGDPEAFTEALRTVLTDDACRERLARGAKSHRDAFPGWDATARAFAAAVGKLTA